MCAKIVKKKSIQLKFYAENKQLGNTINLAAFARETSDEQSGFQLTAARQIAGGETKYHLFQHKEVNFSFYSIAFNI